MQDVEDIVIDDEKLISEVEYNGKPIWDPKEKGHSDQPTLTRTWSVVITNLGLATEDKVLAKKIRIKVRGRWSTLKNTFAREYRKEPKLPTGSAPQTFKSSFVHYKRLQFLKKTLEPAKSEGNFSAIVEEYEKEKAEENPKTQADTLDAGASEGEESSEEVVEVENMAEKSKSKAVKADEDKAIEQPAPKTLTLEFSWNDANMHFFCSLNNTMNSLPPTLAFQVRTKIMGYMEQVLRLLAQEATTSDDDDDEPATKLKRKKGREYRSVPPLSVQEEKDFKKTPAPQITFAQPQSLAPLPQRMNYAHPNQVGQSFLQVVEVPMPVHGSIQEQMQDTWGAQMHQETYQHPYPPQPTTSQSAGLAGGFWDQTNYQRAPSRSASAAPQMSLAHSQGVASHSSRPASTAPYWPPQDQFFGPTAGPQGSTSRPASTAPYWPLQDQFFGSPAGPQGSTSRPASTAPVWPPQDQAFGSPAGPQGSTSRPASTAPVWPPQDQVFGLPARPQGSTSRPQSTAPHWPPQNQNLGTPVGPQASTSRPPNTAAHQSLPDQASMPPPGPPLQSSRPLIAAAHPSPTNQGLQFPARQNAPRQPPPRTASVVPNWKPKDYKLRSDQNVPNQQGSAAPVNYQGDALPPDARIENAGSAFHRPPRT